MLTYVRPIFALDWGSLVDVDVVVAADDVTVGDDVAVGSCGFVEVEPQ